MTEVNLGLTTSSVNVNLVGGAPVQVVFEQGEPKQVVFEQGEPRQVVLSLANTVLSTGSGGSGGYPALTMPTGFSVSGNGTALIAVTYSAGYSLPTTAKQSEWDSAFTDRFKWDGGSTGLNASTGRASLQLGGAATLNVGTAAGNVVQLDGAGKLPAIDGSQLTNLPATGGAVTSVTGSAPVTSSGGTTPVIGISAATTSAPGSMSAADKTKLDGIAAGAEVNVNADWNASSGDAQILNKPMIPAPADVVPLAPGTAAVGTSTEYAREDHVHPLPGLVSSTTPGLASAEDKQKIDLAVVSNVTGITGADAVTNIVSLTQAEYNAIASPSASTLYVITS